MIMPLHEKIQASRVVLEQVLRDFRPDRTAVAWTAGKDSTVVLWLWRSLLQMSNLGPVLALNLDTGLKFPEIIALRDELAGQWNLELHVQTPEVDLSGYAVAQDTLACCRDLKVLPLMCALERLGIEALLTGLRRDEHPDRAGREVWEARSTPDHVQVNPILDWSEMDVWACILEQGLPYCPLYDQGYRSLGCMPCTRPAAADRGGDERSGRDQGKERQLELLRSLGYF